jgi:hypothetical protein
MKNMSPIIELHNAFKNVKFEEENHIYTVSGKKVDYSSSSFGKMFSITDFDQIAFFVARKRCVPKQVVLDEWNEKGEEAGIMGTIFHLAAENLFNNKLHKESLKKLNINMKKALFSFYNSSKERFVLIRNELVVAHQFKNALIGGMVDNLSYDLKDECFCIIDWKTNEEIDMKSKFNTKLIKDFSEYDECKFILYSIQLSLYKLIIELNCPSIKIKKLILININKSSDKPKIIKCLDFSEKIYNFLNR